MIPKGRHRLNHEVLFDVKTKVCFLSGSAADWGGASRVLFSILRQIDTDRIEPLVLLPSEGPVTVELESRGIHYEIWGQSHEFHGASGYVWEVAKISYFLYRNGVHVLHINHANYWRPAEIIAARLLRIPVVTHYHVVIDRPGPYVKYSTLIVANSRFTAESSSPKGIKKAVVFNPVDIGRFSDVGDIRHEMGLSPGQVVVSFLGQIREIKGIDLFIGLTRRITDPNVRFLIAGDCRDPKKFHGSYTVERLEKEIGGDKRVRYVGYRQDVENIYGVSDIIVMPSRWDEPFGLINIEAGAARKPIVATRVGGIPEIIRHGENGFLVERDDLDGMVAYVSKLIADPELRRRQGERAREIVESEFVCGPVRELERIYEQLADGAVWD